MHARSVERPGTHHRDPEMRSAQYLWRVDEMLETVASMAVSRNRLVRYSVTLDARPEVFTQTRQGKVIRVSHAVWMRGRLPLRNAIVGCSEVTVALDQ